MLLLDVDGVLTDGGIILIDGHGESKRFDVQDGMGVNLARAAGLRVGIVTSRTSEIVERRAQELNIDDVLQGVRHKPDVLDLMHRKHGLDPSQIAFIGDDLQDVGLMRLVGIPIAVQNAVPKAKECSVYVTKAPGGHGAVREAVEWLLELKGTKEEVYERVIG